MDFNTYQILFNKVKNIYKETKNLDVQIKFAKGIFFTMRSSVNYRSLFRTHRKYNIYINLNKRSLLSELDEINLTAWFAHELAHIVEYEKMSRPELLVFVVRYIFNPKFRFTVEKRVNTYAAQNGFAFEMFTTWKKFLSLQEVVHSRYKQYVVKNYYPDWGQVKDVALRIGITEKEYNLYK